MLPYPIEDIFLIFTRKPPRSRPRGWLGHEHVNGAQHDTNFGLSSVGARQMRTKGTGGKNSQWTVFLGNTIIVLSVKILSK